MPAHIVNLRRVRKEKARAEKEQAASGNRTAFGRTKAEKAKTAAERVRVSQALDGHRRDPGDSKP